MLYKGRQHVREHELGYDRFKLVRHGVLWHDEGAVMPKPRNAPET